MWSIIIKWAPTNSLPTFKNNFVQSHVGLGAQGCCGLGGTFHRAKPPGLPWQTASHRICHLRQDAGASRVTEIQGEGTAGMPVTAAVPFSVPVGQSPQRAHLGCGLQGSSGPPSSPPGSSGLLLGEAAVSNHTEFPECSACWWHLVSHTWNLARGGSDAKGRTVACTGLCFCTAYLGGICHM